MFATHVSEPTSTPLRTAVHLAGDLAAFAASLAIAGVILLAVVAAGAAPM